jgi:hypothetical protein
MIWSDGFSARLCHTSTFRMRIWPGTKVGSGGHPKVRIWRFASVPGPARDARFGSDLAHSPTRLRMTGICAHRTAGVDVRRHCGSRDPT